MTKKEAMMQLNQELTTCQQCDLAHSRNHVLPGEGSLNARLFLIAQAPGEIEDKKGDMFLGPSGKVLNHLLKHADIKRDDIYMTNLIKCHLPHNRKPKHDEIQACHSYLDQEIDIIQPDFLIPLGHYATRYILQKYEEQIPSKHDFYKLYGALLYLKKQKIYPVQHPAAALHDESILPVLEKNYQKLKVFSHSCIWFPVCPMRSYYEQGRLDDYWIECYCKGDWKSCVRYQMEEQHSYHEDWMLPNGELAEILKEGHL